MCRRLVSRQPLTAKARFNNTISDNGVGFFVGNSAFPCRYCLTVPHTQPTSLTTIEIIKVFFHQLMHNWIVLKTILNLH
jgi:hypothetical protein